MELMVSALYVVVRVVIQTVIAKARAGSKKLICLRGLKEDIPGRVRKLRARNETRTDSS